MGLEVLYPTLGGPQPNSLVVDIVAIHGLNGDPKNTWKHSNAHSWLQDSLPLDIKGVRVLNYGYNADVVFGRSTADIWDHAKNLLGSLIDERETDDESKRPIIFIAHSLGGIIVKQALAWAHREPRYQNVKDHTLGVVFFRTPHRGSDKATYGKTLANVATGVMHKPRSKLLNALQSNSDTLMRLTSEFKFEAPNMEIMTFYETKPMGVFSSLIVDKHSALLELSHEDSQPVDANHRDMCKFDTRNDETYKKLVKRVNRMLKGKENSVTASDSLPMTLRNKYFELPFDVSPYFTGRDDIFRELRDSCLPSGDCSASKLQRRFVLYGLGGSGKTQMALKFASDHRESFWGIFFVGTSSADVAEQAFSKMARVYKAGDTMESFKKWLTNSPEPWLLILDNADDPLLDVSRFFPLGNRGTIIITSRNPDCKCHAPLSSRELRDMETDEAITLLLRSGDLPSEDQNLRDLALPIVQTLGHLALAVSHAGASIRQRTCALEDYLDMYERHRKKLLSSRPVQTGSDYKYTVFTTWEISVNSIKKLARNAADSPASNALDLLTLFGFCHFDDITEDMFRSARKNLKGTEEYPWWASNLLGMIRDPRLSDWDSLGFKESIQLLSSYSLIHVSGLENRISLHPLVHSWIRDSLDEVMHTKWWNITISTLALAWETRSSYHLRRQLRVHLRHCIGIGKLDDLLLEDENLLDRVGIASQIIYVYTDYPYEDAAMLSKRAFEYSTKLLGDECYSTCYVSYQLARCYNHLNEYQKASDLLQDMVDVSMRVVGPTDILTLNIMGQLSVAYRHLGRKQEGRELAEKRLEICEKRLDESDDRYLDALSDLAVAYSGLDRNEEAVGSLEKVLAKKKEIYDEEDIQVLYVEYDLALTYFRSGQYRAALEMFQNALMKDLKFYGEEHPRTLDAMINTAIVYGKKGQPEEGIPLAIKALEIGARIGLEDDLERWNQTLKWLQSKSARLQSQSATSSTTVSRRLLESPKLPHPEGDKHSSKTKWRLWPKSRRRMDGSSS